MTLTELFELTGCDAGERRALRQYLVFLRAQRMLEELEKVTEGVSFY